MSDFIRSTLVTHLSSESKTMLRVPYRIRDDLTICSKSG